MCPIPVCATDCTNSAPIVSDTECVTDIAFGEIKAIYFSSEPLPNWRTFIDAYMIANPTHTPAQALEAYHVDFKSFIDNSATTFDAIRKVLVRGEKGEAESNKIRIAGGGYVSSPKKHSITYSIDETGDENYNALRELECNGLYHVMYEDEKYLYGDGAEGSSIHTNINWNHIIPQSQEELQSFVGSLEWTSKFSPARIEKPV